MVMDQNPSVDDHAIAENVSGSDRSPDCPIPESRDPADERPNKKLKKTGNILANYECNVCFELAKDAVLTACGHLYCWPCLFVWLNNYSNWYECPVCQGLVEDWQITPVYGRAGASSEVESDEDDDGDDVVSELKKTAPPRPPGRRVETARPLTDDEDIPAMAIMMVQQENIQDRNVVSERSNVATATFVVNWPTTLGPAPGYDEVFGRALIPSDEIASPSPPTSPLDSNNLPLPSPIPPPWNPSGNNHHLPSPPPWNIPSGNNCHLPSPTPAWNRPTPSWNPSGNNCHLTSPTPHWNIPSGNDWHLPSPTPHWNITSGDNCHLTSPTPPPWNVPSGNNCHLPSATPAWNIPSGNNHHLPSATPPWNIPSGNYHHLPSATPPWNHLDSNSHLPSPTPHRSHLDSNRHLPSPTPRSPSG